MQGIAERVQSEKPFDVSALHALLLVLVAEIGARDQWHDVLDVVRLPVLMGELMVAAPLLVWRRNTGYTDAVFRARYAHCALAALQGHACNDAFSIGLLWLAPHTWCPPHAHPAEEMYHLLAGVRAWQLGRAPAMMRTGATQLLAVYRLRGVLDSTARLVPDTAR